MVHVKIMTQVQNSSSPTTLHTCDEDSNHSQDVPDTSSISGITEWSSSFLTGAAHKSVHTFTTPQSSPQLPNTDNLLNIKVPKTTLLGKEQAKRRLQAFSLSRQNVLPPIKKNLPPKCSLQTEDDKFKKQTKKSKKGINPVDKAKAVIEEIEEIKKIESEYLETLGKGLLDPLRHRSRSREKSKKKQTKRKNHSRSKRRDKTKLKKERKKRNRVDSKSSKEFKFIRDEYKSNKEECKPSRDETRSKREEFKSNKIEYKTNREEFKPNREFKLNKEEFKLSKDLKLNKEEFRADKEDFRSNRYEFKSNKDEVKLSKDDYKSSHEYKPSRDEYRPSREEYRPNRDEYKPIKDDYKLNREEYKLSRDEFKPNRNDLADYPTNWSEIKLKGYDTETLVQLKPKDYFRKDNCVDFRRQLLFQTPSLSLQNLPIKCVNGKERLIHSEYIRYTSKPPRISYSVKENVSNDMYSRKTVLNYIPRSYRDIVHCFINRTTSVREPTCSSCRTRTWYPKKILTTPEHVGPALGLSLLQNCLNFENETNIEQEEHTINTDKREKSPKRKVYTKDKSRKLEAKENKKDDKKKRSSSRSRSKSCDEKKKECDKSEETAKDLDTTKEKLEKSKADGEENKKEKNKKKDKSLSNKDASRRVICVAEKEFGTPDTEEYHSNWESDLELSVVLTEKPLDTPNVNKSWESDDFDDSSLKTKPQAKTQLYEIKKTYKKESPGKFRDSRFRNVSPLLKNPSSSPFKSKYVEDFLEIPLNLEKCRKDYFHLIRNKQDEPMETDKDLSFNASNDSKLYSIYNEDSWERDDYFSIKTEDIRLEEERRKIVEERRKLKELERQRYYYHDQEDSEARYNYRNYDENDYDHETSSNKYGNKDESVHPKYSPYLPKPQDKSDWEDSNEKPKKIRKTRWQAEQNEPHDFINTEWKPLVNSESMTDNLNVTLTPRSRIKQPSPPNQQKPQELENEYEKFMQSLSSGLIEDEGKVKKQFLLENARKTSKRGRAKKKSKSSSSSSSSSNSSDLDSSSDGSDEYTSSSSDSSLSYNKNKRKLKQKVKKKEACKQEFNLDTFNIPPENSQRSKLELVTSPEHKFNLKDSSEFSLLQQIASPIKPDTSTERKPLQVPSSEHPNKDDLHLISVTETRDGKCSELDSRSSEMSLEKTESPFLTNRRHYFALSSINVPLSKPADQFQEDNSNSTDFTDRFVKTNEKEADAGSEKSENHENMKEERSADKERIGRTSTPERSYSKERKKRSVSPYPVRRYERRSSRSPRRYGFSNRRKDKDPSPRRRTRYSPYRLRKENWRRRSRSRSPRRINSNSKRGRNSISPRRYGSRSPKRRIYRSVSRDRSPFPWRHAGLDSKLEPPHGSIPRSPLDSPVHGFKRSIADSTISDDQLLIRHNLDEFIDSPHYVDTYGGNKFNKDPTLQSPKRISLDERINQVLGMPTEPNYDYQQQYFDNRYDQYYGHYPIEPIAESYKYQEQERATSSLKVLQIGNVLQVVPIEEPAPVQQNTVSSNSTQKIVQIGNMLQIVPTASPEKIETAPVSSTTTTTTAVAVTAGTKETLNAELLIKQKLARRAEKAKRRQERERKRKEKEKKRKEREKRKQMKNKLRTEAMIKQALILETEMGPENEDNQNAESLNESQSHAQWPPIPQVIFSTTTRAPGKGILCQDTGKTFMRNDEQLEMERLRRVQFSDGVMPGEGTSTSGGEELSSPPPATRKLPKEKRFKKVKTPKKVKPPKKKKVKVKVIRQHALNADNNEEDDLPPPPPPPGSPPPHIFPARIKQPIINNVHPKLIPNQVEITNYPTPQHQPGTIYRPPVAMQHNQHHGSSHMLPAAFQHGHHTPQTVNCPPGHHGAFNSSIIMPPVSMLPQVNPHLQLHHGGHHHLHHHQSSHHGRHHH